MSASPLLATLIVLIFFLKLAVSAQSATLSLHDALPISNMRDGLRRELLTQKVIEREVTSKVAVTEQEIADFFNANRAQFNLAEDSYHIAQIVVTPVRDPQLSNRSRDDAATPQAATAKTRRSEEH